MEYGVVHHFPGGTKEQYEAAIAVVHPPDGLPEGQIHHFAGETDDGWIVVGVHTSKESWEKFRDGTLMPGLQSLGDKGLPGPPEEMAFQLEVDTNV